MTSRDHDVLPIRMFLVMLPTSSPSWLNALTMKGNGSLVSAGIPENTMVLLEPAKDLEKVIN